MIGFFIELLAKIHPANWLFQDRPADDEDSIHAAVKILRELIPKCPQCGSEINGHSRCLAASWVLNEQSEPTAQGFLDAIDSQNWTQAFSHQQWEWTEDDLELYFMTCPDGRLTVVVILAPYALEEPYTLMRLKAVSTDADVAAFLQTRDWRPC